jgi:hypothetical protein
VPETNPINDDLSNRFIELNKIRAHDLKEDTTGQEEIELKQETQLVIEQLIWLTSLSENIVKTTHILLKQKMNSNKSLEFIL